MSYQRLGDELWRFVCRRRATNFPVNVLAATDRTKSHLDPSNKKDGIEMGSLAGLKFVEFQSSPHNNKSGIALGLQGNLNAITFLLAW